MPVYRRVVVPPTPSSRASRAEPSTFRGDPYSGLDRLPIPDRTLDLAKKYAGERPGARRFQTSEDFRRWLHAQVPPAPAPARAAAVATRPAVGMFGQVPISRREEKWMLEAIKTFSFRDEFGRMQTITAGRDYAAPDADWVKRFPNAWKRSARPCSVRTSALR